jgi:AcrR family transcriptional regulator
VSPRPYQKRTREVATAETRARIIEASRALLTDPAGAPNFTIDAVAQRADVARMTVYYQFKSKRGLLEALFDDLAQRGQMSELRKAFTVADPATALESFIETFVRFWSGDRVVIRRLNALAALDAEVEQALRERGSWRREGLTVLVQRLKGAHDETLLDVLHMLTSFETYDALATAKRKPKDVTTILQSLARTILKSKHV